MAEIFLTTESFKANPNVVGYYPNQIDNRYHEVRLENPNYNIIPGQVRYFTIDDYFDGDIFIPQENNYTFEQLCNLNNPTPNKDE